jgi:hypothetical protein
MGHVELYVPGFDHVPKARCKGQLQMNIWQHGWGTYFTL